MMLLHLAHNGEFMNGILKPEITSLVWLLRAIGVGLNVGNLGFLKKMIGLLSGPIAYNQVAMNYGGDGLQTLI